MERTRGVAEAVAAVRRGELVVLPTDTVYGLAADAFNPAAVTALLDAKDQDRATPPSVLVGSVRAAQALLEDVGTYGQDLIDEFWPGALTLVCRVNPNLTWDLGETKGTVAVRMPMHPLALEVLKETGPLAVSSANTRGVPAARAAEEAEKMLGEVVAVYLDDGPSGDGEASSIVDLTGPVPRLLRAGAISEDKIRSICGVLLSVEDDEDDLLADPAEVVASEEVVAPEKVADPAEVLDSAEVKASDADGRPEPGTVDGTPVDLVKPEGRSGGEPAE
jgi:tRNA threonylcarbamoyl adenosine modification protein (Sua5/YciO/YrdC/YwlC family)